MAAPPKFVQRLARLPEALTVLAAYPEGLALRALADQFGVTAEVMREDLVMFMDVESWGWMYDIFRPPVVEFVGADEDARDADEHDLDSTLVRVVHDSPGETLGVEHLSAGDLALIYTAGLALLDADAGDPDLQDALAVIAETMYGEPTAEPSPAEWNRLLPLLQQAREERRRVDIEYSNAWRVVVSDRTIEPLRLVQTKRGWEVDAGPLATDGNLRTFLLSNIRTAELTDESFEAPSGLEQRLANHRKTTTVRMALRQAARWAPDMYAEHVTVVSEDEDEFIADLELLPPLGERIALLLLAGGGESRLLHPAALLPEATDFIEALISHHSAE